MSKSQKFRRKSRLAFAAAVMSIVALAAVAMIAESLDMWVGVTLNTLLMGVIVALFVVSGESAHFARRFLKIERGEGVVARWIVDPATWTERQASRRELDAQPGVFPTSSDILSTKAPAEGIEVVICENLIHMSPNTWLQMSGDIVLASAADSWLAMDWETEDGGRTPSIRLPLPRHSQGEAERVIRYFSPSAT